MANYTESIERISDDQDYQVITIYSVDDMAFVSDFDYLLSGDDYLDEGTEVEVHCLVDCDGGLDERDSKVIAVAHGREVELSEDLFDAVKACLNWVPDAAEVYSNEVMLGR